MQFNTARLNAMAVTGEHNDPVKNVLRLSLSPSPAFPLLQMGSFGFPALFFFARFLLFCRMCGLFCQSAFFYLSRIIARRPLFIIPLLTERKAQAP